MYVQLSIFPEDNINEKGPRSKTKRSKNFQVNRKQDSFAEHESNQYAWRYKTLILNHVSVYALYDKVGETIAVAFIAPNDVAAERNYISVVTAPEATVFTLNPQDFQLIKLSQEAEVVRSYEDYAESLIEKIRHERAERYLCDKKEVTNE